MSRGYQTLLTDNILSGSKLTDPLFRAVQESLQKNTFVCLRGIVDPEDVAQVKEALKNHFRPEADQKLDPARPDLIRQNYQRLFVGGTGKRNVKGPRFARPPACGLSPRAGTAPETPGMPGASSAVIRPRFLRTFYNPLWDRDIYGCHGIFKIMIDLRNRLYGLAPGFAAEKPEQGLWTAARIHHYPRGGGFMAPHCDDVLSNVSAKAGLNSYYQVILLMSKKGLDYEEGGGYLEINGTRIFFEDTYEPGDLVIYDGRTVHGVEEIDSQETLDLRSLAGRLAAFVSLYRLQG